MNASERLHSLLRGVRIRRGLDLALSCAPWALVVAAMVLRFHGIAAAVVALMVALALIAVASAYRARRLDALWLIRRLNTLRADMDDSADLLFASAQGLTGLQSLQRSRLQDRLAHATPVDLRPAWSTKRSLLSLLIAALVFAVIALWPAPKPAAQALDALSPAPTVAALPGQPRLTEQALRVDPPSYTRLPPRSEPTLEARVPQGSNLRWTLRFQPQPASVALVFHDGLRLPLRRQGEDWIAQRSLAKSALYRIEAAGAAPAQSRRLYRLDVTPDRAPQLRVLEPDRGLTLMAQGQRAWPLMFEATDDYGLASSAQLRITLAQGSGENITFREQRISLRGIGAATQKRYAQRLDLTALGFAVGDDLIVQLSVDDNRSPQPQTALSPSLILRWPADLGSEATGLEGMVKTTLPAYFRSQRQIIIDAEALIPQRRKLGADEFLERSDAIGVDQRLLRLRYGQFLGEEAEGEPRLPTNDEAPAADAEHKDEHGDKPAATQDAPHDDHDHAPNAAPAKFGEEGAVLEEYGHTHDHAEAATLLDPGTRKLLKAALDEMWQSELHLRQGEPKLALPYAYKALGFIKQVQQASRIYLARVGPELPPIDESRRLSGDRKGLARREDALIAANAADPLLGSLWLQLQTAPGSRDVAAIDYGALERWLGEHDARVADPLAFAAALDNLRNQPDCASCRAQLRSLLWPLLTRPPASVTPRDAGDALDRRYFEALQGEGGR
ncbi:DUF4175 domain-containing protein [Lysobacter capsici]|uniref:hypothetical protein n=1 Tax=Lysobacter capsici TaxID=435897 RepID=UPI00177F64CB|nr:hypothetical protein [Lysobacter capsici]UOF12642.1 DUF4175 domain-containing protein [Lysobacter capsici]